MIASAWDSTGAASLRGASVLLFSLFSVVLSGCGEQRARPVNVELAKATLVDVLNHWKAGGTIDELRTSTPEIVVQELQWTNGRTLQDFSLVGDGRAEDANWFCEVELTLSSGASDPVKKKVTYVVGTDPVLTVFHAIL